MGPMSARSGTPHFRSPLRTRLNFLLYFQSALWARCSFLYSQSAFRAMCDCFAFVQLSVSFISSQLVQITSLHVSSLNFVQISSLPVNSLKYVQISSLPGNSLNYVRIHSLLVSFLSYVQIPSFPVPFLTRCRFLHLKPIYLHLMPHVSLPVSQYSVRC
jgi:hypothetical protein